MTLKNKLSLIKVVLMVFLGTVVAMSLIANANIKKDAFESQAQPQPQQSAVADSFKENKKNELPKQKEEKSDISKPKIDTGASANRSDPVVSKKSPAKNIPAAPKVAPKLNSLVSAGNDYGSGVAMSSLIPGAYLNSASAKSGIRFKSDYDGLLKSIKIYWQWSPGYGGGNGGSEYLVELREDDGSSNHRPLMTRGGVLATATWDQLASRKYKNFPIISFPKPASLKKEKIYHFVMTNLDANPSSNWGSTNHFRQASNAVPHQPAIDDIFAVEKYSTARGWTDSNWPGQLSNPMEGVTPIYQLTYTDGHMAGTGYMEVRAKKDIGGAAQVRETFKVSGSNRAVISVAAKIIKVDGSSPLIFRLEKGDGTLIEEVQAAGSSGWVSAKFSKAHTLVTGNSYNLIMKSKGKYTTDKALAQGSHYGFASETYFGDGHAQYTTDGSVWRDWPSGSGKVDFPFYFT